MCAACWHVQWTCLPAAIAPGVDYDGTNTSYDRGGIFTGSVTVVNGTPIATCESTPRSCRCAWHHHPLPVIGGSLLRAQSLS